MDGSNSLGIGCMTVFAVSGSVAFLAIQAHRRLLSDFMKRIEFEFGSKKCHHKKKVRFAQKAIDSSSEKESCKSNTGKQCLKRGTKGAAMESHMPLNRLALYRGIIEYRMHFIRKDYDGLCRGRNPSHGHFSSH